MYTGLLHTHSALRYLLLLLLLTVIVMALAGVIRKRPYSAADDKFSLVLFIVTHLQLLTGIVLYIVSYTQERRVQFNSETMSTPALRYFAVEHVVAMLIAIALITRARIGIKKLADGPAKHRRMLIFNSVALIIILGVIYGLGADYNTM